MEDKKEHKIIMTFITEKITKEEAVTIANYIVVELDSYEMPNIKETDWEIK